jgi:hypothetical protein
MLTQKELRKVSKLKNEILNLAQFKRGKGLIIKKVIENINVINKYIRSIPSEEYKKSEFFALCILPYISDGNKFMYKFEEFYTFLSKFNFTNSNEDVIVFRCMSNNEFEEFKKNGNQAPSWTKVLTTMERWASIKIVTNECDSCIEVAAVYSSKDIIMDSETMKTGEFGMNDEFEYFIKKGSKPKAFIDLSNYDIDWFENVFGCNIDDATITPEESENGYNWYNVINSKNLINLKPQKEHLEIFFSKFKYSIEKLKNYSKIYPSILDLNFKINMGNRYNPMDINVNSFNLN